MVTLCGGKGMRIKNDICDRNSWRVVKTSDRIDIIKRQEIEFVSAPNLHWTDTVFSCDTFGELR